MEVGFHFLKICTPGEVEYYIGNCIVRITHRNLRDIREREKKKFLKHNHLKEENK